MYSKKGLKKCTQQRNKYKPQDGLTATVQSGDDCYHMYVLFLATETMKILLCLNYMYCKYRIDPLLSVSLLAWFENQTYRSKNRIIHRFVKYLYLFADFKL
jgi:hypothetical protein